MVLGGGLKEAFCAAVTRRGPPVNPLNNTPLSPTNISPSSPHGSEASSPCGRGGFRPPSYQFNRTGGKPSRAGKSQVTMEEWGNVSGYCAFRERVQFLSESPCKAG